MDLLDKVLKFIQSPQCNKELSGCPRCVTSVSLRRAMDAQAAEHLERACL